MKRFFITVLLSVLCFNTFAQIPPAPFPDGIESSWLDEYSHTQAEIDAMVIPAGITRLVWNVTAGELQWYNGTDWVCVSCGSIQDLEDVISEDPVATSTPNFKGNITVGDTALQYGSVGFNDTLGNSLLYSTSSGAGFNHDVNFGFLTPLLYHRSGNDVIYSISQSTYNATTNTPALANTDTDLAGQSYIVGVAGTRDFGAGNITLGVGDIIANDGSVWYKLVDNNQSGGGGSGDLLAANNLSDLDDSNTAVSNLGFTATVTEINRLDGITATTTELNYVDGVTSPIQTQIDNISVTQTIVEDATVTGTYDIDWDNDAYYLTLIGDTTLTESNLPASGQTKEMKLFITGEYALTLPANWDFDIQGEYVGGYLNTYTVDYLKANEYVTRISNGWSRNLVADGNFDNTSGYWTAESGWTFGTNDASYDAVATTRDVFTSLMQSIVIGDTVDITFTISGLTGGDTAFFRLNSTASTYTSYTNYTNGTHTETVTYTGASASTIRFEALNSGTGGAFTLSNVSLRKKL